MNIEEFSAVFNAQYRGRYEVSQVGGGGEYIVTRMDAPGGNNVVTQVGVRPDGNLPAGQIEKIFSAMDSPADFPFTGSIPIPAEELTEAFRLGGLLLEVKDDGKTREWDLYTQAGEPVNNVVLPADGEAADVDLAGQNIAKAKAVELHSRGAFETREIDSAELDGLASDLNQQLKSKMPAIVKLADEIRSHYWRLTQPQPVPAGNVERALDYVQRTSATTPGKVSVAETAAHPSRPEQCERVGEDAGFRRESSAPIDTHHYRKRLAHRGFQGDQGRAGRDRRIRREGPAGDFKKAIFNFEDGASALKRYDELEDPAKDEDDREHPEGR